MRIKRGWTLDEAFAALSPAQHDRLNKISTARAEERDRVQQALQVTRDEVRQGLAEGVPARVIADLLGVTIARVYQMKTEAEKADECRRARG